MDSVARTFPWSHIVSSVFRGAVLACHCDMGVCRSMTQRRLLGAGTLLMASLLTACGNVQSKEPSQSPDLATRLLSDAANTAESVVSAVNERLGVPVTAPVPPTPAPAVEEPPVRRPRPAPVAKAPAPAAAVAPVVPAVVEDPRARPCAGSNRGGCRGSRGCRTSRLHGVLVSRRRCGSPDAPCGLRYPPVANQVRTLG